MRSTVHVGYGTPPLGKRALPECPVEFWDTHTQTVTLLSTPTPPVEFWDTHRQTVTLLTVHTDTSGRVLGHRQTDLGHRQRVSLFGTQTDRQYHYCPHRPPRSSFGTQTDRDNRQRVSLYGGGARELRSPELIDSTSMCACVCAQEKFCGILSASSGTVIRPKCYRIAVSAMCRNPVIRSHGRP